MQEVDWFRELDFFGYFCFVRNVTGMFLRNSVTSFRIIYVSCMWSEFTDDFFLRHTVCDFCLFEWNDFRMIFRERPNLNKALGKTEIISKTCLSNKPRNSLA